MIQNYKCPSCGREHKQDASSSVYKCPCIIKDKDPFIVDGPGVDNKDFIVRLKNTAWGRVWLPNHARPEEQPPS